MAIYWIIGTSSTGKTYYSRLLANELNTLLFHLDDVKKLMDMKESDIKKRKESYQLILNGIKDGSVVEGVPSFKDVKIIKEILKPFEINYIFLRPDYDIYLKQTKMANTKSKTQEEYIAHCKKIKDIADDNIVEIK